MGFAALYPSYLFIKVFTLVLNRHREPAAPLVPTRHLEPGKSRHMAPEKNS
ncbi:hypothetical protein SAMN05421783_103209 [Thiocapsa roseopersicina]|uniref:Uncharacterized protein n=1 Tax=Thiocapsa roseopersicina TaxID=1058 RepID=A0A1H2SYV4_THIRO|nr:hypothetical protein SAMN05421783_103209 [Thiocapsa roseopersicina]